jgi:hypothetical protein
MREDKQSGATAYYIGRTYQFDDPDPAKPIWQIKRITYDTNTFVSNFANYAKYDQIWDNRAGLDYGVGGTDPIPEDEFILGDVTLIGLSTTGRVSKVSINNTGWTAIPAAALNDRQSIAVQNLTGGTVLLNWDNTKPITEGMVLANGNERYYTVGDSLTLYAVHTTAVSAILNTEELA